MRSDARLSYFDTVVNKNLRAIGTCSILIVLEVYMNVVILNCCEALVQLQTGKCIRLWHSDGNVAHLVRELQKPLNVNPDCTAARITQVDGEKTQSLEVSDAE